MIFVLVGPPIAVSLPPDVSRRHCCLAPRAPRVQLVALHDTTHQAPKPKTCRKMRLLDKHARDINWPACAVSSQQAPHALSRIAPFWKHSPTRLSTEKHFSISPHPFTFSSKRTSGKTPQNGDFTTQRDEPPSVCDTPRLPPHFPIFLPRQHDSEGTTELHDGPMVWG